MTTNRAHRSALLSTLTAAAVCTLLGAGLAAPVQGAASRAPGEPSARPASHRVVKSGLDNPRQLSLTPGGQLLVAQAGHGATDPADCVGEGEEAMCIGRTGRVSLLRPDGSGRDVMRGLLSAAGPDGTFAVGVDGAAKQPGGPFYGIMAEAPPDVIPAGLPGWQAGKLLASRQGGGSRVVADIARFEERRDPDGEGVESNPYSVLALRNRVLVADAAGDSILQVRNGRVSLWALMPEYGRRVDAVPTTLTLGPDGRVYVGELHSEKPGKAMVHRFSRSGRLLRSWGGFTTVTGIGVSRNGTMYVAELFGGDCGFGQIPSCFPGRVVRVAPDGGRAARDVPFPAGVAVRGGVPFVNAFSVSPSAGFGGNPAWSGQVWRLKRW